MTRKKKILIAKGVCWTACVIGAAMYNAFGYIRGEEAGYDKAIADFNASARENGIDFRVARKEKY
jgi:hypothetical protein